MHKLIKSLDFGKSFEVEINLSGGTNDTPMVWNEQSGWRVVVAGDWIVEDGLGGHFPCASEVFESIYEKVSP